MRRSLTAGATLLIGFAWLAETATHHGLERAIFGVAASLSFSISLVLWELAAWRKL